MTYIYVLLLLFSVYYAGHTLVSFLRPSNIFEKIGLAWLVGMQFLCFEVFLLLDRSSFLLAQSSLLTLIFFNVALSAIISKLVFGYDFVSSLRRSQRVANNMKRKVQQSKFSLAMVTIIFVMLLASLVSNLYWPIHDWDALALYDFRAKVLLATGDIEEGKELGYFYHYPMFTSFLHSFLYVFSFEQAKIWYTLLYGSTILVFYGVLRKSVTHTLSLVGATLLALSPLFFGHSLMAYTNLAYTAFASLGFIYLTVWLTSKNNYDLITGALLVAMSTLVRTTEPFWITSCLIIILGAIKNRSIKTMTLAAFSILLILYLKEPWNLYVAKQTQAAATTPIRTLQHVRLDTSIGEFINRVSVVVTFFFNSVIKPQKYYYIAVTLGLIVILKNKLYSFLLDYLPFVIILSTILGGTFLFSYLFVEWESIPDSASRMAMILIPVHIYLLIKNPVLSTKNFFSEKKK